MKKNLELKTLRQIARLPWRALPLLIFISIITFIPPPHAEGTNPHLEGIRTIKLTESEIKELSQWVTTSKTILDDALNSANGVTLNEANEIYLIAIKQTVISSFKKKARNELLMRYALNYALELTCGVPSEDGLSIAVPGVLSGISNLDLLTIILEDSIKLAISYYKSDKKALREGPLLNLPYGDFADKRLALGIDWLSAIHEPGLEFDFAVKILEQWLATVYPEENLKKKAYGQQIIKVDRALKKVKDENISLFPKIRYLRGVIGKMTETFRKGDNREQRVSSAAVTNSSYRKENFEKCFKIYYSSWNSEKAANRCLELKEFQFVDNRNFDRCLKYHNFSCAEYADDCVEFMKQGVIFGGHSFFMCYSTYYESFNGEKATRTCARKVKHFDFGRPGFITCYNYYKKSIAPYKAADRCIELAHEFE